VPKKTRLTVATVNVNGIRAAVKNGMEGWIAERKPDIVTMQEVRAPDAMVADLVRQVTDAKWSVVHDECEFKGRAGVAVAAKKPISASRSGLKAHSKKNAKAYNDTGRWIEADLDTPDGKGLTVISAYVHTGDAEQPDKMKEKLAFTDGVEAARVAHRRLERRAQGIRHQELERQLEERRLPARREGVVRRVVRRTRIGGRRSSAER
jgi:exodeoxyribonuclease-3